MGATTNADRIRAVSEHVLDLIRKLEAKKAELTGQLDTISGYVGILDGYNGQDTPDPERKENVCTNRYYGSTYDTFRYEERVYRKKWRITGQSAVKAKATAASKQIDEIIKAANQVIKEASGFIEGKADVIGATQKEAFDILAENIYYNKYDAANDAVDPIARNKILDQYWLDGDLEFVEQDNGVVLITQGGIAMGFTTKEAVAAYLGTKKNPEKESSVPKSKLDLDEKRIQEQFDKDRKKHDNDKETKPKAKLDLDEKKIQEKFKTKDENNESILAAAVSTVSTMTADKLRESLGKVREKIVAAKEAANNNHKDNHDVYKEIKGDENNKGVVATAVSTVSTMTADKLREGLGKVREKIVAGKEAVNSNLNDNTGAPEEIKEGENSEGIVSKSVSKVSTMTADKLKDGLEKAREKIVAGKEAVNSNTNDNTGAPEEIKEGENSEGIVSKSVSKVSTMTADRLKDGLGKVREKIVAGKEAVNSNSNDNHGVYREVKEAVDAKDNHDVYREVKEAVDAKDNHDVYREVKSEVDAKDNHDVYREVKKEVDAKDNHDVYREVKGSINPTMANTVAVPAAPSITTGDIDHGEQYHQVQTRNDNCAATAMISGVNMLLGENKYTDNAGEYTKIVNGCNNGMGTEALGWHRNSNGVFPIDGRAQAQTWLDGEGLSNKIEITGLQDIATKEDLYRHLQNGDVVVASSKGNVFKNSSITGGHYILFYKADENGNVYANDPGISNGAGVLYTPEDLDKFCDVEWRGSLSMSLKNDGASSTKAVV